MPIAFDAKSFTKYFVRLESQIAISGKQTEKIEAETYFVTGKLGDYDWKGCFISGDEAEKHAENREKRGVRDNNKAEIDYNHSAAHYLLKKIFVKKALKSAFAASSALGLYELLINGKKIGDDVLTPGWTSYDNRVQYQLYDVSPALKAGENTIALHIGTGWFKGELAFYADRNVYGNQTAGFLNLVIDYADGEREIIATSEDWKSAKSPLLFTEIYHGEIYDARLESDFSDESNLKGAEKINFNLGKLFAQSGICVKMQEKIPAKKIIRTPKGETVVDFGQNMSGFVEFSVNGERGDEVSFRCFEELDSAGNAYTGNLRRAQQRIKYICRGGGNEVYHSHFSPQGFRYIVLEKWAGEPELSQFTAIAIYSDMEKTGDFSSSSALLNQLQHNIEWGMKSNFLDIPLDCPQRNERLGWTGDAQIFCSTASFLRDTQVFFSKWLIDLALDQYSNGEVPHVIPDCITKIGGCNDNKSSGSAAWADAAVIVPWNMYLVYGASSVIENQFASMKAFVDWMYKCTLFDSWPSRQYGDWISLDSKPGSFKGATPDEVVCIAYEYYSTLLFSKMCTAISRTADAEKYKEIAAEVKKIFIKKFFQSSGRMRIQTQTAHILALHFGLFPEGKQQKIAADLVKLIEKFGGHLATGFVGTPYLLFALSNNGKEKEAYDLLLKEDFPSWLYQVKMGATTIWEHWDGKSEDGKMWSEEMNSFNHYAYGSVGDWLYKAAAGLLPDEKNAGYKHFFVRPIITNRLDFVNLSFKSAYGKIGVKWERDEKSVVLSLRVPANTSATISLLHCTEIKSADSLSFSKNGDEMRSECPSGIYKIEYRIE